MHARRRRVRPHLECAESRAGRLSRLAEPEGASGVESSDMAPRVRSEGSLPFIWWLCWTGTYGAARVASSASTRCRWKAACHILPPHRHGPAGGSRSDAARDEPSPGNLRPSGRRSHQGSTSLPSLVQARTTPVRDGWEVLIRATVERRFLRAVFAGIRRVWPSRRGGRLSEACCFRAEPACDGNERLNDQHGKCGVRTRALPNLIPAEAEPCA
jgi:hypothetical protein